MNYDDNNNNNCNENEYNTHTHKRIKKRARNKIEEKTSDAIVHHRLTDAQALIHSPGQ